MTGHHSKKVVIISPSLKMGGIERALTVLGNYLDNVGFSVVFILCLPGNRFFKLNPAIKILEFPIPIRKQLYYKFFFYLRLLYFIRKQVKQEKPTSVLTFGDVFNPLVLLSLLGTSFPVYISDRTSPDFKFRFPIPQLKKWLYPKSSGIISQTKRAADYKYKQFGKHLNIRVIPNAVREVKIEYITREKIILYVGRLSWEKGPDRLIKAFSKIENKAGWKLYMAGDGPWMAKMKTLAKRLQIENDILFFGKVTEVDYLLSRASIFVLPSVLEGFPNALCEAMAAGLPCICFETIPYQDIMEKEVSGLVVKDNDIVGLKDQIKRLMFNEAERLRIGYNAQKIRERLKLEIIGQQIIDFIFPK